MAKIRLENIYFFGFKDPAKQVFVDFSSGAVSVIFGENGSGKTSFLKAISAFLSQDDSTLAGLGIRKITCDYSIDGKRNNVKVERKEISYDWSSFIECSLKDVRSISFGVERGISTKASRIEPELIYEFFLRNPRYRKLFAANSSAAARDVADELAYYLKRRQNSVHLRRDEEIDESSPHLKLENIKLDYIEQLLLSHYRSARYNANLKIQSALFNTLADAIDRSHGPSELNVRDDLYQKIVEYKSRLIEALSDDEVYANQFKRKIVGILGRLTEAEYYREVQQNYLLGSLFSNMIEELEREKLALGFINILVDKFNSFLINDKKLTISSTEIYVSIGVNRHSVHDLSSGERQMLTFLSLVLFQGMERDFLIIDEPEISLNIVWQRQLLELFHELVPKTQIIVASHSPFLTKRNTEYLTPLQWKNYVQS